MLKYVNPTAQFRAVTMDGARSACDPAKYDIARGACSVHTTSRTKKADKPVATAHVGRSTSQ